MALSGFMMLLSKVDMSSVDFVRAPTESSEVHRKTPRVDTRVEPIFRAKRPARWAGPITEPSVSLPNEIGLKPAER